MNVLIDGEIVLHGVVGDDFWSDGFVARDVIDALARLGRAADVTVRINSGGGIATEGAAIYSVLKAHGGKVSVVVEGIAASAASIIAMAGETVTMTTGAIMMIHEPSGITLGTSADHEKSVEMLEAVADSLADIYAEKTGRSREECRADMREELWLTADEAVEKGYADATEGDAGEDAPPVAAFDYRIYQHAPERIVALADARGWTRRPRATAPAPTPDPGPTPSPAPAPAVADVDQVARAAEIARLCADANMAAAAADFITGGATVDEVRERTSSAVEIRQAFALAHGQNPATDPGRAEFHIAARTPVERVRTEIINTLADLQSPEILGGHQAGETPPAPKAGNYVSPAVAAAFQRAIDKVNARFPKEKDEPS
ncbi:MAG: head maturation protease, ClpP-related [Nitratireductor sp.]